MARGQARILKTTTNGPYMYEFTVDGVVQKCEVNLASVTAAVNLITPQVAAMPGTIQIMTMSVTSA